MSITPKLLTVLIVASIFVVLVVVVGVLLIVEAIASWTEVIIVWQVTHLLTLGTSFRHFVIALVHILTVIAEVTAMMWILTLGFRFSFCLGLGLAFSVSMSLCFSFGTCFRLRLGFCICICIRICTCISL